MNVGSKRKCVVQRGKLLFYYSYNCWYWIQAKVNVLDNVYLNGAITCSTGKSWGVDLILLFAQSIFSIFPFYKRKSSGWKKNYLDVTMKLWLQSPSSWQTSNFAHIFIEVMLQDLLLWNQLTAPENSVLLKDVKKSGLPVKNMHG